MTDRSAPAVVRLGAGRFGLITDAVLRARVLVDGRPLTTPAREIMDTTAPVVCLGDTAAEALMLLLERDAEFLLVTDRAGELRGVVCPRDFAISPITVGVSLHEQLRRATSIEELATFAGRVPPVLDDLLSRGLAAGRVIAVYSGFLDTIMRRAIGLVFARHPELSVDAFTWLSLGSNGRREAVLSSDVDSAVAFDDAVDPGAVAAYRAAFAEVSGVLATAGLSADGHGTTAQSALFSRTNAEWRAAGRQWLADPVEHKGAIMTSLLVDGRPIHGDPGLPAVSRVFSELREHPGTMRLLLQESLAYRAQAPVGMVPGPTPGDLRHQEARVAAGREHRPLGRAQRGVGGPADHRSAPGRSRIRDAARRRGRHADRGVRRAAATAPALPDPAVPGRGAADRRRHAEAAVAAGPQRGRAGGPGDLRGPAPDGQHVAVRRRGGVGVTGVGVNGLVSTRRGTAPDRTSVGGGVTAPAHHLGVRRRPVSAGWAAGSRTAQR